MTSREKRAAENENLFRRINERVEQLSAGLHDLSIVCECADAACVKRISGVPVPEYEAVRAHGEQFFVARGHERAGVETVVRERAAYLIVSKQGLAGEVARDHDPRAE